MSLLDLQSMRRHPLHTPRIYQKICLRLKIWSVVLRPGQKPHWPSSNFDSTISWHFFSRHLTDIFPGRLRSDIPPKFVHYLRFAFLVYKNDHTCLPVFWCFYKFSRHQTHPRQPTYSFFVQCLQHFWSNFVFTSSLSGFQSSYGCCHFC